MRGRVLPRDVHDLLVRMLLFDLAANTVVPQRFFEQHHDRIGVPVELRPLLNPLKAAAVVGLLVGRRNSPLRALTSACLVVYFLSAFGYHRRAGDGVVFSAPAVLYGAVSAAALLRSLR